ncbi:acetylornithine deacetylase [Friedmanniella luteola]|uniref:Acetylornithine deacetylase n=1 Tax=Friedmanniella luteola TaxID=546871 RepID=A0A1H1YNW7_9ACTN|nr:ArgE/DapE family deacylase [Friedmanniella luteola]SDT23168.1 acetylornithine deacetylase [Friedmanniella luteola]
MLTATEAAALALLDEAGTVATLRDLVAVPSVGGSDAEVEIQALLARRLTELGHEVDHWPLDLAALRAHPDHPGEEAERAEAWGLVGTTGGRDGEDPVPALVLEAHVDVVLPGDLDAWSSDPFTPVVDGDDLVARGSNDMKGGLAAVLAAAAAVRASGAELVRPLAVHCVVGEEDGGLGAFATLQRGHRGAACVIPEPTGLDLVTANAGALTFRIEVPGVATHGSTAYVGVSAIDRYLGLHRALAALQERRNADPEPLFRHLPVAYPISVGRLVAGDWPSSVPDLLVAEGRYGLRVEEDPTTARAELEAAVAEAADADPFLRDHPPVVTWRGGQFAGGHLPSGHVLRDVVGLAHSAVAGGPPPRERGAPYGSDLRLYAAAGVPTLHYGPGDIRTAHGPDERVPLAEVLTCARVLTLAVLRLCT